MNPLDEPADPEANLASWMKITTIDALREYQRTGPPIKTAVIYVRQSRSRDGSESVENQVDKCQRLAAAEGLKVVAIYEDRGVSGKDFGKRKVDQCIGHVERGEAQVVIMWKWSRFGRNLYGSLHNLARLDRADGIARAVTEDVNARTAMGKYSRNQLLAMAEWELDRYSEGWKESHERRMRVKGLPATGTPRFGYVRAQVDGMEKYVPDPVTGSLLVEAYERYIAGEGMQTIARDFNRRGITSVRGQPLSNKSLMQILDNGFAAGFMRVHEHPVNKDNSKPRGVTFVRGSQETLIDEGTWRKYLAIRRSNKASGIRHSTKPKYALSGRLFCATCSALMIAASQGRKGTSSYRRTWRCSMHLRTAGFSSACSGTTVGQETAERLLEAWIASAALDLVGSTATEEARRVANARPAGDDLPRKIAKLSRKKNRIMEDWHDGLYDTKEERDRHLRPVREELERLEDQQALVQIRPTTTPPDATMLTDLAALWPQLTVEEKRAALAILDLRGTVAPGRWGIGDKVTFTAGWNR
jgi:site-specific DNA recombinase